MARNRTTFVCETCGGELPKWVGRCPSCSGWNTLRERTSAHGAGSAGTAAGAPVGTPVPIGDVPAGSWEAVSTGIAEVDRVLGGGLVPGSVTLLGGEPGVGKSTLLMQVAASMARQRRVLYVTAEESPAQVRQRADRLGALPDGLWLVAEVSVPAVIDHARATDAEVVVVDSIQAVADPAIASAPGSVAQVREAAATLVGAAKADGWRLVLVGHVTKDGALAGPRVLEHVVDTVLSFDGDRHHALRLLRARKHRFGSTAELGVFEMEDGGLTTVADPSARFLVDRRPGLAGSSVVPTLDGRRPLLVEVQALLHDCVGESPRRAAQGIDVGRLGMLLAVLRSRAGLPTGRRDVHVSAVGGARVADPGADLGVALAIASAVRDVAVPDDVVACAEVGLGGELRRVSGVELRLREAARLGFRRAIVPPSVDVEVDGCQLVRVAGVAEAVAYLDRCPPVAARSGPWPWPELAAVPRVREKSAVMG